MSSWPSAHRHRLVNDPYGNAKNAKHAKAIAKVIAKKGWVIPTTERADYRAIGIRPDRL